MNLLRRGFLLIWNLGSIGFYMTQNLWYIGSVIQQFPKLNDIATPANPEIKPFITLGINLK